MNEGASPISSEPSLAVKKGKVTKPQRFWQRVRSVFLLILVFLVVGGGSFILLYDWSMNAHSYGHLIIQTRNTMKDVQTSMVNFQTEYNRLPLPDEAMKKGDVIRMLSRGSWISELMGREHVINHKKIKYLDISEAREKKRGVYVENGELVLVDNWGNPYQVILNLGRDAIPNPEAEAGGKGDRVPKMLSDWSFLYSAGPDGNPDTWEDNITIWR